MGKLAAIDDVIEVPAVTYEVNDLFVPKLKVTPVSFDWAGLELAVDTIEFGSVIVVFNDVVTLLRSDLKDGVEFRYVGVVTFEDTLALLLSFLVTEESCVVVTLAWFVVEVTLDKPL